MRRRALALGCLAALLSGTQAIDPPRAAAQKTAAVAESRGAAWPLPVPVTAEGIAEAIRRLGDDSYELREKATEYLWEARLAALPALEAALASDDPEVISRARRVLERSKYGIFPDTPDEIARLAVQYREGNTHLRRQMILNLVSKGADAFPTLVAISRTETDAGLRTYLAERIRHNARGFVQSLILADDLDAAEQILDMAALSDEGIRELAAYELAIGRLDRRVEKLRTLLAAAEAAGPGAAAAQGMALVPPGPEGIAVVRRQLAWFQRAAGDLDGAIAIARTLDDARLLDVLLYDAGRWNELADRLDKKPEKDIEDLGHLAAYHRLSGNAQGFDEAIAAIQAHAAEHPDDALQSAKALFINDRPNEAIELLKSHSGSLRAEKPWVAFDHLCMQGRYREALAFAREYVGSSEDGRFELQLRMAEVLHDLGHKDDARETLDKLAGQVREKDDLNRVTQLATIAGVERKLGQFDSAWQLTAEALVALDNPARPGEVLGHVFTPRIKDIAAVIWPALREIDSDLPVERSLARLDALLAGPGRPEFNEALFSELVETGTKRLADAPDAKRAEWQERLANLFELHGRHDEARQALARAAVELPGAALQIRLGHAAAQDGQWEEAAGWYSQAIEADPSDPLPHFYRGVALERLGRADEGKTLLRKAEILLCSDAKRRSSLAQDLEKLGLKDEAIRQRQFIARTAAVDSLDASNNLGQIGNAVIRQDGLRAGDCWERSLLPCLRRPIFLSNDRGMLTIPHLIRKARGRGLLDSGRTDEALVQIELSRRYLPTEVDLAISFVPALERAGRTGDADALFQKIYEANDRNCGEFPDSSRLHNEIAWLAVKTNRRLDDALRHARRAVELEPDNAAYIDTLAEVEFARGNKAEAIRRMERCLELEPRNEYYRRQLERFRE